MPWLPSSRLKLRSKSRAAAAIGSSSFNSTSRETDTSFRLPLGHGAFNASALPSHFVSCLRIDSNSRRRFALVSGKVILSLFERVEDNLGYDQSSILLVVGGNDIPGRITGACRTEAFLIGLHVLLPEFPLLDVRKAEFPILFRLVDACQETLSLFFLGEVEEELDDTGSVGVEMSLQIHDRTIPVVPDRLVVVRRYPGIPSLRKNLADARGRSAPPRSRIG